MSDYFRRIQRILSSQSILKYRGDAVLCLCCVLQRVIDVLKIDVEAGEWPFLRNLVDVEPNLSDYIRQMVIEIHTPYAKPRQLKKTDVVEMIYYATRLSDIGFTIAQNRHLWWCCGVFSGMMPKSVREKCCYENVYVNTRFLDKTGP